jgi:hypothetical protein
LREAEGGPLRNVMAASLEGASRRIRLETLPSSFGVVFGGVMLILGYIVIFSGGEDVNFCSPF